MSALLKFHKMNTHVYRSEVKKENTDNLKRCFLMPSQLPKTNPRVTTIMTSNCIHRFQFFVIQLNGVLLPELLYIWILKFLMFGGTGVAQSIVSNSWFQRESFLMGCGIEPHVRLYVQAESAYDSLPLSLSLHLLACMPTLSDK